MKSTVFKNLVLGFYACVGFLLLFINSMIFEQLTKDLIMVDITKMDILSFSILATLPFFIGIIASLFNTKFLIFNIFYFIILNFVYIVSVNNKGITTIDIIIGCIMTFTILVFLISFGKHPHFSQFNYISKNSDTILDKFEENYHERKVESYFLRIHRIFSFAFIAIGIGIITLSTQTGGHISVDEGLGLTFLGFVLLGFAFFLWKFPRVASWITALICLGMFIFGETLTFELSIWSTIQNPDVRQDLNWIQIISILIFGFSFLFLTLIAISKTAREEWKMK